MSSVSIIVPHFNDVIRLEKCLHAIFLQATPDVEVVVADNDSDVDLSHLQIRWPELKIVVEREKGAGPARNAGVAVSTAPKLMFIDSDCVPSSDWISVGLALNLKQSIVGGRVDLFDETDPPRSGAQAFEHVFAFKMKRYLEKAGFLGAGNLALERETYDLVGPFLPSVSEDREWTQRAAKLGIELRYNNSLVVSHPSRSDWSALKRKHKRLTQESFLLLASGFRGRRFWITKALLMPASIVVHMPRVLLCSDLNRREKLLACITLFRLRILRMFWMIGQVFGLALR